MNATDKCNAIDKSVKEIENIILNAAATMNERETAMFIRDMKARLNSVLSAEETAYNFMAFHAKKI